ncbi:glutathione S-transferase family protein [Paracoccus tibetensis]|uniref:Glutathione S-transferase n=1 Tax=Paracoccus tibetensis TaxID=336292 RepID=A0A1G5JXD3_9RHOB|nr:glutathione S-transferase family protein [Paracoccus tibetensis]SCY92561.1 Glutathione S-transferase [Paracoccus tibetensis]
MKLYNFSFGPYPQRLNIYLAEKNPHNVDQIIFSEPNPSADVPPARIKALTATGSLPILRDDDGTVVEQSLVILEYLEERLPGPDMLGATAAARARTRQLVQAFDEAMTFFALWARHGSRLGVGKVPISMELAQICGSRFFDQLRLLDRMISAGEFVAGDHVSIADCMAMATLQYAHDFYGVPVPPDCERLTAWLDSFSLRPSARRPPYPEAKRARALGLMEQTGVTP